MKTIIIIGAGPIGLYLAILLKRKGINVIVFDPRANKYTREGFLNKTIFLEVEKRLETTIESGSQQIKDLEHSLYNIAISSGVRIENSTFINLENKKVKVLTSQGTNEFFEADIVIDASGSSRCIINAVNQIKPNTFTLQKINDDKPSKFIFFSSKISKNELDSKPIPSSDEDMLSHFSAIKHFRDEFAWSKYTPPEIYSMITPNDTIAFYLEMPDDISSNQYTAWIEALLQFRTKKASIKFEEIISQENLSKNKMHAFTVNPKKVTEALFDGDDNYPMIIPVGHAQMETDFRYGTAIDFAIRRIDCFLNLLFVDNETKTFNLNKEAYKYQLENIMNQQVRSTLQSYFNFYDMYDKKLIFEKNVCALVWQKIKQDQPMTAIDEDAFKTYTSICDNIVATFVPKAYELLNQIFTSSKHFKVDNQGFILNERLLDKAVSLLTEAVAILLPQHELAIQLNETLQDIILEYIRLANLYMHKKMYSTCLKYAKLSLDLLSKFFDNDLPKETAAIQKLILQSLIKLEKYDQAIQLADNIISNQDKLNLDTEMKNSIIITVKSYCLLAMLSEIEKDKNFSLYSVDSRAILLPHYKDIADEIGDSGYAISALLLKINKLLDGISLELELIDQETLSAKLSNVSS